VGLGAGGASFSRTWDLGPSRSVVQKRKNKKLTSFVVGRWFSVQVVPSLLGMLPCSRHCWCSSLAARTHNTPHEQLLIGLDMGAIVLRVIVGSRPRCRCSRGSGCRRLVSVLIVLRCVVRGPWLCLAGFGLVGVRQGVSSHCKENC
jgi:hypothetical protein